MSLSANWLTEKWIDFEFKKYQLLAYLQEVRSQYALSRIYPALAEVITHYRNLLSFREKSNFLKLSGKKGDLTGMDWKNLQLTYSSPVSDDEMLAELSQIVDFAVPLFHEHVREGKSIYDLIESNIRFSPVGITPLNKDEGYLLLSKGHENIVNVYHYQLSIYTSADEQFRSLGTTSLGCRSLTYAYSLEKMKIDLIKERKELPNPAVFSIVCALDVPIQEALLPVAKRFLVSKISF